MIILMIAIILTISKIQAVKLAKEIGAGKAAKELGIPVDTLYGWQKAVREGRLDAGPGSRSPGVTP